MRATSLNIILDYKKGHSLHRIAKKYCIGIHEILNLLHKDLTTPKGA